MTSYQVIGWISLILSVVGLGLFIRRVILWYRFRSLPSRQKTESDGPTLEGLTLEHTILVISNGVQQGPFTRQEVQAKTVSGLFTDDAVYWEPGMTDWLPVKNLS